MGKSLYYFIQSPIVGILYFTLNIFAGLKYNKMPMLAWHALIEPTAWGTVTYSFMARYSAILMAAILTRQNGEIDGISALAIKYET